MLAADTASTARAVAPLRRLLSLDVTRGIAIAAMLIVNSPGSWTDVYGPLRHAEWHGCTPTDLIFPIFLFVVGVSMTFSFAAQIDAGASRGEVMLQAARRAAVLVILGLALESFPWWRTNLETLRLPGVLQRIGVSFLLAAWIVLWFQVRGLAVAASVLLVGYWALMALVPAPGVGPGIWEPGQDLSAFIDRAILGTRHLLDGQRWDPLGLLGTLPAAANVLLGALASYWLRRNTRGGQVVRGLLLAGVASVGVGLAWGTSFPINKNLWTSSYTVFAAGWAVLLLAACYWSVEVRGHRIWARPFAALGVNAIFIYVAASLADRLLGLMSFAEGVSLRSALHQVLFASWLPPKQASLAYALGYLTAWIGVAAVLDRRGLRLGV